MVQSLLNTGQFKVRGDTLYYKRVLWLPLAIMEDDFPVAIYLDLRTLPGLRKMVKNTDMSKVILLPFSLSNPGHGMTREELFKEILECYLYPEVYQVVGDNKLSVLKSIGHILVSDDVDTDGVISELTKKWERRRKLPIDMEEFNRTTFVLETLKGFGIRIKIIRYFYVKNKNMFSDYKYVW